MKKALTIIACVILATVSLSAQEKGEMSVGGTFGFGVNSYGSNSSTSGEFTLAPEFGYFIIDNLELNTGIQYGMTGANHDTFHTYTVGIGLSYFLRLCNNFYYTPGFFWNFGGATNSYKDDGLSFSSSGFKTGLEFNLAKFEVKLNDHFGLTLGIAGLDYNYIGNSGDGTNMVDFGFNSKIGFKYYF